jgi:cyclic beta-1,2-glucan glucanotransferase
VRLVQRLRDLDLRVGPILLCLDTRLDAQGATAGVPERIRTLILVPTLLTGHAAIKELFERLEVHYLANLDGDLRFALLSD